MRKIQSKWIVVILAISIVAFRFVYPPYHILTWDVFGYYLYLPALFIHGDLGLRDISWVNQIVEQYQTTSTLYQVTALPNGGWVMKYSSGIALLNLPAFLLAHLYCLLSGFKADGFSVPYHMAWAFSGLIYTIIGLWMMRKILLTYFNEATTSLLLVILVLGTNYFQLTAFDGYLSHNYLFTIYTFIVWYTIRWHENPRMKYAAMLGLFIGLAVLSRPNEMVCVLIPLLWNITTWESVGLKIKLFSKNISHIIVAFFFAFIIGAIQLVYWKFTTGNWLFYSYNNAGEGFDFSHPYILQVLFSFRKGWFIYTPIMVLAVLGFWFLYRRNKNLFLPLLSYFVINLYIVSSWTCWWYAGGSYSQRALLSSYVLLMLPLGYLIEYLRAKSKKIQFSIFILISFLLLLNLFQTWQWVHGVIDGTRMSKAYYFAVFGKTNATDDDRKLLLVERSVDEFDSFKNESEYKLKQAASFDFEGQEFANLFLSTDTVYEGAASLQMDAQHSYSPAYEAAYYELTMGDHAWLRAGVRVFPISEIAPEMASLVITFEHNGELYGYRAYGIDRNEFGVKPFQWNYIQVDYLTPEVRSINDKVKIYFWLQGNKPVIIDNMKIEVFEPK